MDATFISIHDLTPEARILYSSDSVIDLLGYTPDEIVNRSCWEFFAQEELPYAQSFHRNRVTMDKAAVLVYCRVKSKDGEWIGCECCFTIVYDVMIVCTSRYEYNEKMAGRARSAPVVRRIFTSSPKDPRYHMLSHLSTKFTQSSKTTEHEPRAALFLNRFTRSLTVMYATSGIEDITGITADEMRGTSFYYCVASNCMADAVKCLEHAKGNHSIAYLRFWFQDPRTVEPSLFPSDGDSDEEMTVTGVSGDEAESSLEYHSRPSESIDSSMDTDPPADAGSHDSSRASSGDSGRVADSREAIFGHALPEESSASSVAPSPTRASDASQRQEAIELEAVVSCASDGLVVCLRRARPMLPRPTHHPGRPVYPNGLFAAPWAEEPMLPPLDTRPGAGLGTGFAPALSPQGARHSNGPAIKHGPESNDFMTAIREQAIFAWALTGINGSLAEFGRGMPSTGSVPDAGLPVWTSDTNPYAAAMNGLETRTQTRTHGAGPRLRSPDRSRPPTGFFGDPGLARNNHR